MRRLMSVESIGIALRSVLTRIDEAVQKGPSQLGRHSQLVAVTKTKPVESILAAYEHGQRHFGENYVQELVEKSNNPQIKSLTDIKWHFIGTLQRNKCNQLASVPNLHVVETVNSERLATHLNNCWGKLNKPPLKVMVQLNTSQEQSKSGCPLDEYERIVGHVIHSCQHLEFSGLMTIGEINYDYSKGPNPDFMVRYGALKLLNLHVMAYSDTTPASTYSLLMALSNDHLKSNPVYQLNDQSEMESIV